MKLTPYKKQILIWTVIMGLLIGLDAALMATGKFSALVGGIVFAPLMGLMMFVDYRLYKKHMVKEAKHV